MQALVFYDQFILDEELKLGFIEVLVCLENEDECDEVCDSSVLATFSHDSKDN